MTGIGGSGHPGGVRCADRASRELHRRGRRARDHAAPPRPMGRHGRGDAARRRAPHGPPWRRFLLRPLRGDARTARPSMAGPPTRLDGGAQATAAPPRASSTAPSGATLVKNSRSCRRPPLRLPAPRLHRRQGRVTFANHANVSVQGRRAYPHLAQAAVGDAEDAAGKRSRPGPLALVCPAQATDPRLPRDARSRGPDDLPVERPARGFRLRHRGRGPQPRLDRGYAARGRGPLPLPPRPAPHPDDDALAFERRARLCAVERARISAVSGWRKARPSNMLACRPRPTCPAPGALTLRPGGIAEVRHVIGAIAWPTEEPVAWSSRSRATP